MIKKLAIGMISLGLASVAMATTYTGNGASGFNGALGNSSLTVTDSGGNINFSLTLGAGGFNGNNVVFFLDSKAGGIGDTSTLTDHADGGREAISGTDGTNRTLASFASGFNADYAISLDGNGNGNLFSLATPSNLTFVSGVNFANPSGTTYTFSLSLANLGMTQGQALKFVASLISPTAFRSNETIGTSTTSVAGNGNPGFTGTLTYSNFDTYTTTAVPEPATVLLVGPAILTGLFFVRRRRA